MSGETGAMMYEVPLDRLKEMNQDIERLSKEPHLAEATLKELVLELVLRGDDLPPEMAGARGILRGTCAMLLRQVPADTLGKRRSEDTGLAGFLDR